MCRPERQPGHHHHFHCHCHHHRCRCRHPHPPLAPATAPTRRPRRSRAGQGWCGRPGVPARCRASGGAVCAARSRGSGTAPWQPPPPPPLPLYMYPCSRPWHTAHNDDDVMCVLPRCAPQIPLFTSPGGRILPLQLLPQSINQLSKSFDRHRAAAAVQYTCSCAEHTPVIEW